MATGVVNLLIQSIADSTGFNSSLDHVKKLRSGLGDLTPTANRFGVAIGLTGKVVGETFKHLVSGGVFGLAAKGIEWMISLWQKHREAVQEAAEAEKKAFADSLTAIDDYRSHIEKCYQASSASSDGKVTVTDGTISAAATYADGNCSAQ